MACENGRANPDSQTRLRLFADSAGYCSRPSCRKRLFSDENGHDYHIAEIAHIIAAMDGGPRANGVLPAKERAEYKNLILLCPSCHTEIDKSPETFPVEMILGWKKDHHAAISNIIGVFQAKTRDEGRQYIDKFLQTNKGIFERWGPNNSYKENPEAEEAQVWRRKVVTQIIPNNQAILIFLDANRHILNKEEIQILESFRQHIDDLIERHLGQDRTIASQFPEQMNELLVDHGQK